MVEERKNKKRGLGKGCGEIFVSNKILHVWVMYPNVFEYFCITFSFLLLFDLGRDGG